ncbi:hypothetical protein QFZ20_000297 [Flavobacterium sp. W4I14]|nr:hypothetical protein [Flavobacterium sp. W4I14]
MITSVKVSTSLHIYLSSGSFNALPKAIGMLKLAQHYNISLSFVFASSDRFKIASNAEKAFSQ